MIRRRFAHGIENFGRYKLLVDSWQLYDNSNVPLCYSMKVEAMKVPVSHSKDPDLQKVSQALMRAAEKAGRREQWLAENSEALDAYNRRVEELGVFSDGLRWF